MEESSGEDICLPLVPDVIVDLVKNYPIYPNWKETIYWINAFCKPFGQMNFIIDPLKRVNNEDICSFVDEYKDTNVSVTYIPHKLPKGYGEKTFAKLIYDLPKNPIFIIDLLDPKDVGKHCQALTNLADGNACNYKSYNTKFGHKHIFIFTTGPIDINLFSEWKMNFFTVDSKLRLIPIKDQQDAYKSISLNIIK